MTLDSVIDAYTAETGGVENFEAGTLQRFIERYPQHAEGAAALCSYAAYIASSHSE